jgi:hypothetical protein
MFERDNRRTARIIPAGAFRMQTHFSGPFPKFSDSHSDWKLNKHNRLCAILSTENTTDGTQSTFQPSRVF